ncbi:hypothetical protein IGI04_030375 [Brassica rapa subsp. trilocularis]|uniref:Uncharacterized protein n=1 Tax=Brassica rapa subsp. trilocularis TaxID=1813537 RepID=A0ABQ7LQJ8_BRACM|nr:hypothetical protein IGI04_030375 [Brassica rapa subsp. trilocularis]
MAGDLPTVRLSPYFDTRYSFELSFQFHWFEVNQHSVAEGMSVLLRSGRNASREKAVEKRKYVDRRTLDIDRYGCKNAGRAYFMTD